MSLDEKVAAAFSRLDADVPDALLRAIAGAFAIIACADGRLTDSEVERFLALVRANERFRSLDLAALEADFRSVCAAVVDDFEDGRARALEAIAAVKADASQRELVVAAAQIAIVADGRLDEVEESVLGTICGALGVDPSAY